MAAEPIVIVGSGLAGWTVAREVRKLDPAAHLVMVTRDGGDFYSKPLLSNAFASGKSAQQLVTTPATKMAQELAVELVAGTEVRALDGRRVETAAGSYPYSRLVLALGADPIRLPLGGDGAHEVLSVNDLDDYARFRSALAGAGRITILGAGLIGCEFANDLAAAGFAVTVADPAARPLASLVPEAAGERLRSALAALGVEWRLGCSAVEVGKAGGGYRVALSDGSVLEADLVLSAVGLRPRVELARRAGLAVNRGIVVDEYLSASAGEVYALGDCAEIGGRVLPYVLPIMHAARALARTLTGDSTRVVFPPMPVAVKTPVCPITVQPVAPGAPGAWSLETREEGLKMLFNGPDTRLHGFVLTGGRTAERTVLTRQLTAAC